MNNMDLMFLGDIHGEYKVYLDYIKEYDIKDTNIIQLGDFGVGFSTLKKEKREINLYHSILVKNNVHIWVVRGNHDNPSYFRNDPFNFTNIHLISDYSVLNLSGKNILFLGGAISVDRIIRTEGKSYWKDENFILDIDKLKSLRNIDIVVSHTAPSYCMPMYRNTSIFDYYTIKGDSKLKLDLITEQKNMELAFDILSQNNNITHHYFGHYHNSGVIEINNIKHRVLNINELYNER